MNPNPDQTVSKSSSATGGSEASQGAVRGSAALGDYELRREVGRGGMGTVYEAWQISLQRTVALKVLAAHVAATSKAVSRFRREAQAAAKLHHTHIVPIFAQGEADGTYFYAMEYVEGESLNTRITSLRSRHRPDSPTTDQTETVVIKRGDDSAPRGTQTAEFKIRVEDSSARRSGAAAVAVAAPSAFGLPEFFNDVARNMADVADALDYAHSQGVIHRDIKPHNLLFGRDGRLRISDFGLARLAEQPGVTVTGEMIGSPLYMSPEQITGDPNIVDHRADIYSLGATMYEWLTLVPPYPGETRERVISNILSSEPLALRLENPSVPIDLETICLKAIERDRDRRYQTAGELRDDLRRFVLSRPIVAKRAGPMTRLRRFVSHHQLASLGTAAALTACVLLWSLYAKEKNVQVQKEATVKAEAAVKQATHEIEVAQEEQDLLVDALRMMASVVPGGGAVVDSVARGDVPRPGMPADYLSMGRLTPTIGTPAGIAGRAIEEFYRSVASPYWPGTADTKSNPLSLNIAGAFERWAAGDMESALGLVEDYLKALPSDAEACQMHAALCASLGRYDVMLDDAERLLQGGSSGVNGYLWRGLANLMQNRIDQSLLDLTRAAALDQQSVWARVFRGLALLQADRSSDAMRVFDEALRTSPRMVPAHLGRARAFTAEGEYAAAIPDVEEVLKIDPRNVHALTIRGECRASMEDYESARKDFEDAMDIAGRVPELLIRWTAIAIQQRGGRDKVESGDATEVKSRRGAVDPEEDSSRPPLFDWLSPRRKVPQSGRDGLDQSTGVEGTLPIRWPLRLPR